MLVDRLVYPFFMEEEKIANTLINDQINEKEVRLIGADSEQLGMMSSEEALDIAKKEGLDLVLIAPQAKPPVCKIIDYSKYCYEQKRKQKEAKKKQKIIEVKEIRFSPNIDTNDILTKQRNARKFLEKGNKVKVTLRFRGREMAHMSESKHVLDDFAKGLEDVSLIEKEPKVEGRMMSLILTQKK